MYRFLIIEDDESAGEALRSLVMRYLDEHSVDARVECMRSAFDFIGFKQHWDLVFMDIALPGVDGMEAARLLRECDAETLLIFVTDLAQFAVRGYEVDALDFVVKPVNYQSLSMRLDRAMRILAGKQVSNIYLSTKYGARVFPITDLIFAEVRGHNLEYHLPSETITVRGTMSKLEEEMSSSQFIRISNSCLINADHIHSINGSTVRMSTGDELAISRTKKKSALEALANYFGGGR
jgi:DNA-binding LytR/AlgR family response regulator